MIRFTCAPYLFITVISLVGFVFWELPTVLLEVEEVSALSFLKSHCSSISST